ncbi:unnamed protein product [Cutaneotrichosporon oleaginosum]
MSCSMSAPGHTRGPSGETTPTTGCEPMTESADCSPSVLRATDAGTPTRNGARLRCHVNANLTVGSSLPGHGPKPIHPHAIVRRSGEWAKLDWQLPGISPNVSSTQHPRKLETPAESNCYNKGLSTCHRHKATL